FRSNIDQGNQKMRLIGLIGECWYLSKFISVNDKDVIYFKTDINSATSTPVNLKDINNLHENYYSAIIIGIDTVLSRINESDIFLNNITIPI
ncbi:MAG: hypothetical protein WCX10_03825, partial [Bacteroidales bacterium]